MGTPKKVTTPIAITHHTELDLSSQHITTANFMEFNVAKAMELVAGQSIDIDMGTFARLSPMPVPTFGNAEVHNRAYFVPFRTIMDGWDEFFNDTVKVDSSGSALLPVVPRLDNDNVVDLLVSNSCSSVVSGTTAFDFQLNNNGVVVNHRFTSFGKYVYKTLCSLGYRIAFDRKQVGMTHSALPLLAYVKVFFDWYYPTAYVDDVRSMYLRKWLEIPATDNADYVANLLTSVELGKLFTELRRVCYDSDYFTAAWDNPVAPNSGAYSPLYVNDVTTNNAVRVTNSQNTVGTPIITGGTTGVNNLNSLSQYAIDALKAVTDYAKRNQLAGARVLDRYLSRFGYTLDSAKLNRSLFIGEHIGKIQFGDVTSMADTEGAELGSYSGKGIVSMRDTNFVSFNTDEYGILLIVSTIVPKAAYYQGQDRMTFHLSRTDFYNPEFDNLGVQALATRELFVPIRDYNQADLTNGINFDDAVFGFVPRYGEYKRGYDNLTGDLALGSRNVGKEGWTLMRDLSPFFTGLALDNVSYDDIVHSQNFLDGSDANQYNRVFYVTDDVDDKFFVIHNFNITSRFPGRSLYDGYDFKDGDKAKKVSMDINGVKAN